MPVGRIVRADFRSNAVLERRDDLAARRVVFRIGGEHHQQIQRQPHGIAFDLDVAFLKDVEQPHLDLARQIRQLVDAENAAVGARQQAVVDGQLVGQLQAAARGLDGIDVADHVGDGDVGRRQLFHVPRVARQPRDERVVAFGGDAPAARRADRRERIVVDLTAGHHRQVLVQERRQRAQDPALRLAAETEEDKVVPRQDGVDQLGNDRLVVADDAGEERVSRRQLPDEVVADFVLHRAPRKGVRRGIARPSQIAEGFDLGDVCHKNGSRIRF